MERKRVLDSWKEIGAYLGRSEKTCRRWEHEVGLPVHRLEESPKAHVFAYPEELDDWLRSRHPSSKIPEKELRAGHSVAEVTSTRITRKITPRKFIIPTVALIAVISATILYWPRNEVAVRSRLAPPPANSIAILPFADLSDNKDQRALCEGFAETILTALSAVKEIQTRGRNSSFLFDSQDNPIEVGRKLNVAAVLTGSLQIWESRIRVTVHLLKTSDGSSIWSDKIDGAKEEIFDFQDRITSTVTAKMNIILTNKEAVRLAKRYTNNEDAFSLYLEGLQFMRRMMLESHREAISLFLKAIDEDPGFALPYVALARCYTNLYFELAIGDREEAYRLSKEALDQAFQIDAAIGTAYAVRAGLKFEYQNDPSEAQIDYRLALQLEPRDPIILESYFWYLLKSKKFDEAADKMNLLIGLEPLSPTGYTLLAIARYFSRQYNESIANFSKAIEVDPNYLNAVCWSIHAYAAVEDYSRAREIVQRLAGNSNSDDRNLELAIIEALSGHRVEAMRYISEVKKVAGNSVLFAAYYAATGEKGPMLFWLKRMCEELPPSWRIHFLMHYFDPYRSDPEFVGLISKFGWH